MPEKLTKTPQQKKALSYSKDRRNSYGENDKSSRKAIPARKAGENRKVRRSTKQSLQKINNMDEPKAETVESNIKHSLERVGGWKKAADRPLKDHVSQKLEARQSRSKAERRTKNKNFLK